MIFVRAIALSMLVSVAMNTTVQASHFNQSADYDGNESAQMSDGQKFVASAAVGVAVGVVGAKAIEKSTEIGGIVGVFAALYAFYLLRSSREDAVQKALGKEYVGVSAIAALSTGMLVYNPRR